MTAIRAVVFLHGYDDDADSWAEVATALAPDGAVVHRPGGPIRTAHKAAWFETADDGTPDAGQIAGSLVIVEDELRKVAARHDLAPAEIALVGFSQGAALALLWALGRRSVAQDAIDAPIGAVVALAGWLPDVPGIDIDPAPHAARVLIGHGIDDEVVPFPLGRSVFRMLERSGVDVHFVEHDVAHTPDPFAADVRAWLTTP